MDNRFLTSRNTAQQPEAAFSVPSRRGLITGLAALIAAPALVRASSIMPVKAWVEPVITGIDLGRSDFTAYSVLVWTGEGDFPAKWAPLPSSPLRVESRHG